ncbi:MAG: glycoside hydrolase family 140 protein [Gemmatimonadaceae bacterium]
MMSRPKFVALAVVLVVSGASLPPCPLSAQAPATGAPSVDLRRGPLRVSRDGRHLVHADGTPFFWLGDTAWELFHRLTREEADLYLDDRRRKGFTVIQAVVLAELDGLTAPNANGDVPLVDNDPTKMNEAYFRHVDYVVDAAARRGMFTGMLPTWGDKFNKRWGVGPEIFTPANARAYGELLGRRYRAKPIIWILGGDRSPERPEHSAIVRSMAEGLRAGDGGAHLMTYHPMGGQSSSRYFHADDWLALNMFQSGHSAPNSANDRYVQADRKLVPVKPVLDGESRYEDHPIDWKPEKGWFDDFDVRQAAYWAVLAGAAGHTYGDHDIWQMFQPGRAPISSARTPWRVALNHPGSAQMGHLRRLFMSRPFLELAPDQSLLESPLDTGASHQRAARARGGDYAVAYTPLGRPLTIRLDALRGPLVRAWWFDPRAGTSSRIGEFQAAGTRAFDPPGDEGRGHDWVLVLDRSTTAYPPPGAR